MHPFLQSVLVEFNVCIMQVVPQSFRHIVVFIFVYEWLGFPLTINLF